VISWSHLNNKMWRKMFIVECTYKKLPNLNLLTMTKTSSKIIEVCIRQQNQNKLRWLHLTKCNMKNCLLIWLIFLMYIYFIWSCVMNYKICLHQLVNWIGSKQLVQNDWEVFLCLSKMGLFLPKIIVKKQGILVVKIVVCILFTHLEILLKGIQ
jgi:hypothetical protein